MPIEFRLAAGQGHTLLVGRYLGDAVEWLLAHTLAGGDRSVAPR
jgi:hypothetical protein